MLSNLSLSIYQILGGCQNLNSHRSAGMQLLGRDSKLSAKAELAAVCKAGAGIYVNTAGVNHRLEESCIFAALRNDAFAVLCVVRIDVADCFFN